MLHNTIITNKTRELTDDWIKNYLKKQVTEKKKTGQDNFLLLLSRLINDTHQFESKEDYATWYITIILNAYMHHATYVPAEGYGKSQQREIDHPLLYARSENKHPFWRLFKELMPVDKRLQCLLPKNEAAYDIVKAGLSNDNNFINTLTKYDKNGYVKTGQTKEKLSYFSPEYGYSGLRENAFTISANSINTWIRDKKPSAIFKHLKKDLNIPNALLKPTLRLDHNHIKTRVNLAFALLDKISEKQKHVDYHPNLYLALSNHKNANAEKIIELSNEKKFENIAVSRDGNNNCLNTQFYPGKAIEDSANYSDGVTNVIINFFIALVNHKLEKAGLCIKSQRRQSFAFNRLTITHTTSMCMRVSLGLEPESMIPIFMETLSVLNNLLTTFNFLDKENVYLKKGFEAAENPKGKKITDKTGNYFLNKMRSPNGMLKLITFTEQVLSKTQGTKHYEKNAFEHYIKHITNNGTDINQIPSSKLRLRIQTDTPSLENNILVTGLLNNLLKFTLEKIELTKFILDMPEYANSYWILISKLTKYAYKADAWMTHHNEHTSSHVYAKTLLLVDDMLEHLAALDALTIACKKTKSDDSSYLDKLTSTESQYAAGKLGVSKDNTHVFFTDNGEQALTISTLCMHAELVQNNQINELSNKIYVYKKSYFELNNNLEKNMNLKLCKEAKNAKLIHVDIREIDIFSNQIPLFTQAKVVIIDSTHNPCLDEPTLKNTVKQLLDKRIRVIVASSMLKHDQLGLDKFQAGKIVILSTDTLPLANNIDDELTGVSKAAIKPVTASWFQMINEICRDKIILQQEPTPAPAAKIGLFLRPHMGKQNNIANGRGVSKQHH